MCTICFLMLVTNLMRGRRMGNKMGNLNIHSSKDSKSVLQIHSSEEDYVPMPRSLRKSIIEGKKLQHVNPYKQKTKEAEPVLPEDSKGETDNNEADVVSKPSVPCFNRSSSESSAEDTEGGFSTKLDNRRSNIIVPKITVDDTTKLEEKTKSLPFTSAGSKAEITVYSSDIRSISPTTITNRKFSLIDLKTGLKKSKFTLDLEDKLRQSKLELGFDTDLTEWKEFTFKHESPKSESRKRHSLEKGIQVGVRTEPNLADYVNNVNKEEMHLCNNNCQILGLCSVGRPEPFTKMGSLEPSIFKEELSRKYNVGNLMKSHSKKVGCPCNSCTLSYLTDMGSHIPARRCGRVTRRKKPRNCFSYDNGGSSMVNENILIKEQKNNSKSIEVTCRSPSCISISHCSNASPETEDDCTNSRIKKMFDQNCISDIKEIYNNPNSSCHDISVERFVTNTGSTVMRPSKVIKRSRYTRSSTSPTQSTESSSSLSTVLSYKRVRHIFQTIIEGNRFHRKTKQNLHKYKEMEELGLGRLRNNHWYPSGSKTFSIWKGMNNSVGGFQAEFKTRSREVPVK